MAVVQISRIQIRRGQKNSGTGLPQLASGEMAWAVDTQELYIGNGSVAEGSPGVGNTKVITQKDLTSENNIFGLVQYVYKTDEELTVRNNAPVTRTLQERLDDQVVATDFGTLGTFNSTNNTGPDDTDTLQFAINQLFLNAAAKASGDVPGSVSARVILVLPPGTFKISKTLYIPSYTTLIGAGTDKTIILYKPAETVLTGTTINVSPEIININSTVDLVGSFVSGDGITEGTRVASVNAGYSVTLDQPATASGTVTLTFTSSDPAIQFVNDASLADAPSPLTETMFTTQPRRVQLSGLSINVASNKHTCLQLDAVRDSLFEDLYISGSELLGPYFEQSRGISMSVNVNDGVVTCENNIFRNVTIDKVNYGVFTSQDILNNIFEDCAVKNASQGFALGIYSTGGASDSNGPRKTQIINCDFFWIYKHAVYIPIGSGNIVNNAKLTNVGSELTDDNDPTSGTTHYPQIYFGQHGNFANNISSNRVLALEGSAFDIVYAPVLSGHGIFNSNVTSSVPIIGSEGNLVRFPVATTSQGIPDGTMSYAINYFFKNDEGTKYQRSGTIFIAADIDERTLQLSDEYNYASTTAIDTGTPALQNDIQLSFSANFIDKAGDLYVSDPQVPHAIRLSYNNSVGGNVNGTFVFTFTAIS